MSEQQKNTTNNNRRPNNNRNKKNYNNNRGRNNKQNTPKVNQQPQKKITPRPFTPKKNKVTTFIELNYSDKIILVIGLFTILISIGMWFMGHREEAAYLGIWVPGIFSAGTFIRIAYTRASRR
jgi:ATP-dependent Zn protease